MQHNNAPYMNRLRKLRIEKGYSQQDMADHVGISLSSYQRYESGKREIPSEVLFRMASALSAPADYILMKAELNIDTEYAFMDGKGGIVELTEEQFRVMTSFNRMTEEGRSIVIAISEALLDSGKYTKEK